MRARSLLQKAVDPLIVVLHSVKNVAAVNVGRVQVGKELDTLVIKGVDVGVADFALQGGVAQQQMDAIDVLACLRSVFFLSLVFFFVLSEGAGELSAHVHHFHRHSHLITMVLYIMASLPLSKSSLRLVLFLVAPFMTLLSGKARLALAL